MAPFSPDDNDETAFLYVGHQLADPVGLTVSLKSLIYLSFVGSVSYPSIRPVASDKSKKTTYCFSNAAVSFITIGDSGCFHVGFVQGSSSGFTHVSTLVGWSLVAGLVDRRTDLQADSVSFNVEHEADACLFEHVRTADHFSFKKNVLAEAFFFCRHTGNERASANDIVWTGCYT